MYKRQVLAHVGGDDGIPVGDGLDGLQDLVGVENVVLLQRHLLVGEDPLLPLRVVVGGQLLVEQLQHPPGVADDVMVGLDVLVDLRPVDVDVDDSEMCIRDRPSDILLPHRRGRPQRGCTARGIHTPGPGFGWGGIQTFPAGHPIPGKSRRENWIHPRSAR